ncbi:MAG: hypothetical protein AABZ28_04025 [Nitrospinota bacterium]
MALDYFGYLGLKKSYIFEGGKIAVLEDFDKAQQWMEEYLNRDGFLYPPITQSITCDPVTMEKKETISNTERPALLHRIPSTHSIEIHGCGDIDELRKGPSAFVINLLGFLLGYRLQFHNWWFDGRVPIKKNNGLFVQKETVEDFISHGYNVWKTWDAENQKLIINLLYMFSRSPCYEWEWERFSIDYMVIDGIWKLHKSLRKIDDKVSHPQRILRMCKDYKIPKNDEYLSKINKLRTELFHESLWDGGQPCGSGSNDAFYKTIFMRNIIKRLVPALIGYKTPFIKTEWWHLGAFSFDKK